MCKLEKKYHNKKLLTNYLYKKDTWSPCLINNTKLYTLINNSTLLLYANCYSFKVVDVCCLNIKISFLNPKIAKNKLAFTTLNLIKYKW